MNEQPIACVTGASSGIGREYARQLCSRGYRVIITGRREDRLFSLREELTPDGTDTQRVTVFGGDLRDRDEVDRLIRLIGSQPRIDLLVHNAGFGNREPFFSSSVDDLSAMVDLHVDATVRLIRGVTPLIRTSRTSAMGQDPTRQLTQGVIFVSSLAAFLPAPGPAIYTATKRFIVELGRALAGEFSRLGLRVQVACPGFTHTDFHNKLDWNAERRRDRGIVRWMTSTEVARRSLQRFFSPRAWRGNDPVYIVGVLNTLLWWIARLMPRWLYRALARRV